MSFFRTVLLIAALLVSWVALKAGLHFRAVASTPTAQTAP